MPKVKYSDEFKREAVAQVVEGHRRRSDVARACGISGTALSTLGYVSPAQFELRTGTVN